MAHAALTIMCTLAGTVGVASLSPSSLRRPDYKHDVCICKNWKSAYKHETATCGKAKEYFRADKNGPELYRTDIAKVQTNLCASTFQRLDSTDCVNVNIGEDDGTWCYTDPLCQDLNGGGRVPGQLSWKKCRTHSLTDKRLRDKTPEELEDFAKQVDLELAGLVRLAYPGSRASKGDLIDLAIFKNDTLPAELISKHKELANNVDPVWFDTNKDAQLPIVIVHGAKSWKVDKTTSTDHMHPGKGAKVTCLTNCIGAYFD